MKEIPLTRGKVALVDDEDFAWLSQWHWRAKIGNGGRWFAMRAEGDSRGPDLKYFHMHRVIMSAPDDLSVIVDHKNRDSLDNRKENLRFATKAQNTQNQSKSVRNKSGFRGVRWDRRAWRAQIDSEHIGFFNDPTEAARAFDEAAVRRWGEFAGYLNFPERIPYQS